MDNGAPLIFRWAHWNSSSAGLEMLNASISSFRFFFGETARYVVFTDAPGIVGSALHPIVDTLDISVGDSALNAADSVWRKWSPRFRFDCEATEIYIDSDFFLLRDPLELREFIDGASAEFIVADEEFAYTQPYGNFAVRIDHDFRPINAGLVGQRVGSSLEADFQREYAWCMGVTRSALPHYHDEQGAVAFALQRHIRAGSATVLPGDKYRIVCPKNMEQLDSLAGIVALHATDPGHPAYARFRNEIWSAAGLRQPSLDK